MPTFNEETFRETFDLDELKSLYLQLRTVFESTKIPEEALTVLLILSTVTGKNVTYYSRTEESKNGLDFTVGIDFHIQAKICFDPYGVTKRSDVYKGFNHKQGRQLKNLQNKQGQYIIYFLTKRAFDIYLVDSARVKQLLSPSQKNLFVENIFQHLHGQRIPIHEDPADTAEASKKCQNVAGDLNEFSLEDAFDLPKLEAYFSKFSETISRQPGEEDLTIMLALSRKSETKVRLYNRQEEGRNGLDFTVQFKGRLYNFQAKKVTQLTIDEETDLYYEFYKPQYLNVILNSGHYLLYRIDNGSLQILMVDLVSGGQNRKSIDALRAYRSVHGNASKGNKGVEEKQKFLKKRDALSKPYNLDHSLTLIGALNVD